MRLKILIINGPNLNMLGLRETSVYPQAPLERIVGAAAEYKYEMPVKVDHFQSNHEGELIDRIQDARGAYDLLVVNAGALTHYSIALRDALLACETPFAEVHLSNVFAREPFRHVSVMADIAFCVISGAGETAYTLAIIAGINLLKKKFKEKKK
ncbi:MAG TPA: type II 3-dehydroquinate dehydratase [Candidatus Wallbacteria bacterium]|nr:type II 3-dehydroquinate dehydratase [Candidatus Wallbacteria bacterium]